MAEFRGVKAQAICPDCPRHPLTGELLARRCYTCQNFRTVEVVLAEGEKERLTRERMVAWLSSQVVLDATAEAFADRRDENADADDYNAAESLLGVLALAVRAIENDTPSLPPVEEEQ